MQLSKEQLNQIKDFVNTRGFTHIEVELEAIDHLASKIEALLEEKPDLSFDKALAKAHSSFGIWGLSSIEDSIKGGIKLKMKNRFLLSFKEILTSWQIIFIPLAIWVGYTILSFIPQTLYGIGFHLFFLFYGFLWAILAYSVYAKPIKKFNKRSMYVQLSGFGLYITQFLLGNGFALLTKEIYMEGTPFYKTIFVLGFVLTTFSGILSIKLMKWGIDHFQKSYIKYL